LKKSKIAIAMSGGVDSSLVAYILKREGYDIFGLTMKQLDHVENEKLHKPCCSLEDIIDAKRICNGLGVPHYTLNLKSIFKEKIIDTFINDYKKGSTPNPCVKCNREVKIGELIRYAKELGADYLATGHYSIMKNGKVYSADDENKDQSYFLAQIRKEDIEKMVFPLGGLNKSKTRELAAQFGIITKDKVDSQGVCFIKKSYKDFLDSKLDERYKKPGDIVKSNGELVGKHSGVHNYTIGQRRGIGVSDEVPLYVIGIDPENNRLIVGEDRELYNRELSCTNLNLFMPVELFNEKEFFVKTRARDFKNRGKVTVINENELKVVFDNPVRAITKGQYAVFYHKEGWLAGSGVIK
tara:strand:- start:5867 stop:6925 length:1059 start_codon:yes stop_codon:yes gene_type:complete